MNDKTKHNVIITRRAKPMAVKAGVSKRRSIFKCGGKTKGKNNC